MNKDLFYKLFISAALIIIIFLAWQSRLSQNKALAETNALKKSIIDSDVLVKEADGRYAKLVNYYNSERDLKNQLKDQNRELYDVVKEQGERLLSITNTIVSLDSKVTEGFGKVDEVDTNRINVALRYPDKEDPFVFWDGWINRNTAQYKGEFTFSKLPIQIVVTEDSRGLWKHRLIGPEWLKVDSLQVNSLPPAEYVSLVPKKIQWLVGGTYSRSINSPTENSIGVGVGLSLFDQHNIIFSANSQSQIGLSYYFKIKSLKKK